MIRLPFLAAAALALSGCATLYESRIESKLVDAGLSPPVAACVAERMVDRLSRRQLHDIGRLAGGRRRVADMNLGQFLRQYRAALDPKVYRVLAGAGLRCALAG
jgi:hypothetical protein